MCPAHFSLITPVANTVKNYGQQWKKDKKITTRRYSAKHL